jgi:cyclophilin family peptidyl-prolyl cis-trans isomerase
MRRLAHQIWNLVRKLKKKSNSQPFRRRYRLCLESLEDRLVPATAGFADTAPAVVTGLVFLDVNNNSIKDPGELVVPGAEVTLKGTGVSVTAKTNAKGEYTFFQVPAGTYTLILDPNSLFVPGRATFGSLGGIVAGSRVSSITVAQGQTGINYNLPIRGLSGSAVSLRDLTSGFTPGSDASLPRPGSGETAADHTVQPKAKAVAGTSLLSGSVNNGSTTGPGLGGVDVTLSGTDNTGRDIILTTTTASNTGSFQFIGLQPGEYTLNVPTQPSGFRADLPSVGSLGGLVLRNDQITHIVVGRGVTGTEYDFVEKPITKASGNPSLTVALADDTAGPNGTTSDGITSDPSLVGNVHSTKGISSFRAGFEPQVAAGTNNSFTVTFPYPGTQPKFTSEIVTFTGTITITETQGTATKGAVETITFAGTNPSGTFKLKFNGKTTAAITYDADPNTLAGNIQSALDAIITPPASHLVNLLGQLNSAGDFYLNAALIKQIAGGTLTQGAHTLFLEATTASGQTAKSDVSFTLQSTPPAIPALQIENPLPTVTSGPGDGVFTVTFGYNGAETTMNADGAKLTGSGASVAVATTTPGTDTTEAVQTVTFSSGVTGGTFTLKFNNVTSDPITWSSDSATLQGNIQSALNKLIGSNPDSNNNAVIGGKTAPDVQVLLTQGTPKVALGTTNSVTVTFPFPGPQNNMTADGTKLTGGTVVVSTTTPGALPSTAAVQTITFGGAPSGGTFTLTFNGQTTGPITWSNTSASRVANIQAALNSIIGTQTTTSAADGSFSFNVVMTPGPTTFTVQATDTAGNVSQLATVLVNSITLPTPADQTVNLSVPQVSKDTSDDQTVNLVKLFTNPNAYNSIVTFNTAAGPLHLRLLDSTAPVTVANFLNYVKEGYLTDAFIQRLAKDFVLQAGGYTLRNGTIAPVNVNPVIPTESSATQSNQPNNAGTIAMALSTGPSSANSQFFFNLADNTQLNGTADGGPFTVFGSLLGPQDFRVLNTLAAFPAPAKNLSVTTLRFTTPGPQPTITVAENKLVGTKANLTIATTSAGAFPGTNAVQRFLFTGAITGGTFKLNFNGDTTDFITWSANSAVLDRNIETALNKLPNVKVTVATTTPAAGQGDFNNTGIPLKNYHGTFPNGLKSSNLAIISSVTSDPTQGGDPLTFTVTGNTNPDVATATVNTSGFAANDWLLLHALKAGTTTVTVQAKDALGNTSTATFNITVPVQFTHTPDQTNIDGAVIPSANPVQVQATDLNSKTLTFTATGLPPGLSISSSGAITGTVANTAHDKSPYIVVVTATDTNNPVNSASEMFTWTINPAINITDPGPQTNQVGNVLAANPTGHQLPGLQIQAQDLQISSPNFMYSATGLPTGLSIDSTKGIITGTIADGANTHSPFHVTVTVKDGTFTSTRTFTWNIQPEVFISSLGNQSSTEGQMISMQVVNASEGKSKPLTYSATGLPTGLLINKNTGLVSGTIASGAHLHSPFTVTVTVSNGVETAHVSFQWTVT